MEMPTNPASPVISIRWKGGPKLLVVRHSNSADGTTVEGRVDAPSSLAEPHPRAKMCVEASLIRFRLPKREAYLSIDSLNPPSRQEITLFSKSFNK
jgi:hypothetical protein